MFNLYDLRGGMIERRVMFKNAKGGMDMNKTTIKLLKRITIENDEIKVYECNKCHWRFLGDCAKFGYEQSWEMMTEIPNYCPMCGSEIDDEEILC